jgi:hypothetical protein
MKPIVIIIACMAALPFASLRAGELSDMLQGKDYSCWKCDAKIKHSCPACHGHFTISRFGKSNQDGRYVRVCSGCADEPNNCCQPQKKIPRNQSILK